MFTPIKGKVLERRTMNSLRISVVGVGLITTALGGSMLGVGLSASGWADTRATRTTVLDHAVHFVAPDGSDLLAQPGEYEVSTLAGSQVELRATGKEPVLLQAQSILHEEALESVSTAVVPDEQNPDLVHVVLLQLDGHGLDAVGSRSGVQTRGAAPQTISSAQVRAAMDKIPPTGFVAVPKGGSAIRGTVLIDVQAKDNLGIQHVQILVDGRPSFCSLEKNAPYTCNWDTRIVQDGPHVLTAVIRDRANNQITTGQVSVVVNNKKVAQAAQPGTQPSVGSSEPAQAPSLPPSSPSIPVRVGSTTPRVIEGEFIIKYKAGVSGQSKVTMASKLQAQSLQKLTNLDMEVMKVAAGSNLQQKLAELNQSPEIEYAEPNYLVEAFRDPNDQSYRQMWALPKIQAPQGWDRIAESPSVVVAVIDSGVDYTHLDLAANMWRNPGEIPVNGIDDDRNGFVDDVFGADFHNNDGDPRDDTGHGTHVAGTIAAVGNNGQGVVGMTWRTQIMALKFLDSSGQGTTANAIRAVDYSISKSAHILNNSWGGAGFSRALQDAIQRANDRGILFVAAAGNNASNTGQTPMYPASYSVSNVISVAATTTTDNRASFSNFGANVHLGAPGTSILSTWPENRYVPLDGTSMATPHVSGVAALLKQLHPAWGAPKLKQAILDSVDQTPALAGIVATGGRLNLANALSHQLWDFAQTFIQRNGLAGFDLASPADRAVALDFNGDGKDDLFIYRPGAGSQAWFLQSNGNGTFTTVQSTRGIAGYDLASAADQAVALDFNGDGKDDLFLYRPGAGSQAWFLQSNGNGTFTTVQSTRGIAGYDLASAADQAVALDFNGDGKDDLFLYRPGAGSQAWLLQSNGNGTFSAKNKSLGVAGYDLANSADIAVAIDEIGDKKKDLLLLRPGQGIAAFARGVIE
jgi:subtilisin family serine protease